MAGIHNALAGSGDGYVTVEITLTSSVNNYVFDPAKLPTYVPGSTRARLVVGASAVISSASTSTPALTVTNSWAAGDLVEVVNLGYVVGRGGKGGDGPYYVNNPEIGGYMTEGGSAALAGGPAFSALRPCRVENQGVIGGGGGGGAYGAWTDLRDSDCLMGGGGGGAGFGQGGAGRTTLGSPRASDGAAGGLSSGGSAGANFSMTFNGFGFGLGGAGGGLGQPGGSTTTTASYAGSSYTSGAAGGAAGPAVVGNSNVTWLATGTRLGPIT